MTPCLKALVNWVLTLCKTGFEACHCTEEFILWLIRPLGQRKKWPFIASGLPTQPAILLLVKIISFIQLSSFFHYCIMTLYLL
jgi:hypothetical protein